MGGGGSVETIQVFLSYSPAEREYARELSKRLARAGFEVWFADERLYPGDNWSLEIGKALKGSDAMVVLVSPESMKSEWVRREIDYALVSRQFKGRLIPVFLRRTRDIPWALEQFRIVHAGKSAAETSKLIAQALRES